MNQFIGIISHTLREEFRRRTLYLLLVFPPLCIYTSTVFTSLTPGSEKAFVIDVSLSAISFFLMLLTVFICWDMFVKEIYQGTSYYFLTNPVGRFALILGKYTGVLIFLFVSLAMIACFASAVIFFKFGRADGIFLKAALLSYGQFLILAGFGIFGAGVFSRFTNLFLMLFIYAAGHLTEDLAYIKEHLGEFKGGMILRSLLAGIPDLARFEARDFAVLGMDISWDLIARSYAYALAFALALAAAGMLFIRKRFTQ